MSRLRPLLALLAFLALVPLGASAQLPSTSAEAGRDVQATGKSPLRAGLYSLGGTVVPMAAGLALMQLDDQSVRLGRVEFASELNQVGAGLLMGGLVVGPALGHFYADDTRHARTGLWIRGGATIVGAGATTVLLFDLWPDLALLAPLNPEADLQLSRTGRVAATVLTGTVVVMLGSALVDVVTAPLSAHQYNETHNLRMRIAPRVHPRLDQIGLAARLQF